MIAFFLSIATLVQVQNEAESHRRMLEELKRVERLTPQQNSYLETVLLKEYRTRIEEAPEDLTDIGRVQLDFTAGVLELRAGDLERAVELLEEGYVLLAKDGRDEYPKLRSKLVYQLALACLRLGETRNCVERHTSQSCILPVRGNGVFKDVEATRKAIRYFAEYAGRQPEGTARRQSSQWLLNLCAMAIGEYPDGVPEEHRLAPEFFESDVEFPRFVDIAPELGINVLDMAGGAAIEDFDGDGRLDIVTSSWDPSISLHLFLRTAKGEFVDRSSEAGLVGFKGGLNLNHADYDSDGDADILVLRGAWLHGETGRHPNSLLRNDGQAHFRDVTFLAGLGDKHYPTQAAGWADYDNDGDLDLYIGNEASRKFRFPSQLFQNQDDATFRDVARAAGVSNLQYTKGVSWGDFDADGRSDLYVSNQGSSNRLYQNSEANTFIDVSARLGVREPRQSFACWFWDYDNDGTLDLYVASYHQLGPEDNQDSGEGLRLFPAVASFLGYEHDAEHARLYRGDGRGGFADVSLDLGLDDVTLTMGSNFGDLDNDGWLDFYLGTGYPYFDGLMPNLMYRNDGGHRFTDVTIPGGFGHLQKGHGVVFADLDRDGDQDVFEQMGGGFYADAFGNVLFENPGVEGHWLKLRLQGTTSNRSAVGAHVRVVVGKQKDERSIYRTVGTGGSFGSNPLELHIGLGSAERVERIEIRWPGRAEKQVFRDLPADSVVRITEGDSEALVIREEPLPFR
ncbi:MAG: hypothetical protein CMJ89_19695 [Planctomycetes bacterium]|nr:hypothetical protein [Planctomycetota bacterium]